MYMGKGPAHLPQAVHPFYIDQAIIICTVLLREFVIAQPIWEVPLFEFHSNFDSWESLGAIGPDAVNDAKLH